MSRPCLVVVSGPPGAGKTTLAHHLGVALGLPVVSRDAVKEGVAYTTGQTVRQGSAEAAQLFDLFYEIVDNHLQRGISLIAEAAFRADIAGAELLMRRDVAELVHVRCTVAHDLWFARFEARGDRPGHRDWEFVTRMRAGRGPTSATYFVDLPGVHTIDVDTTDGYEPGVDQVTSLITTAFRGRQ